MTRPCGRNGVLSPASSAVVVPGLGGSSRLTRPQPSSGDLVGDADQVRLDLARVVRRRRPLLRGDGERVRALPGDVGEAVVEVLGGLAHHQRRRVDQLLGEDARVRVDALTHRVVAHVLDAAGHHDVVRAERDPGRGRRDGGHRAGAHPVDGVARAWSSGAR